MQMQPTQECHYCCARCSSGCPLCAPERNVWVRNECAARSGKSYAAETPGVQCKICSRCGTRECGALHPSHSQMEQSPERRWDRCTFEVFTADCNCRPDLPAWIIQPLGKRSTRPWRASRWVANARRDYGHRTRLIFLINLCSSSKWGEMTYWFINPLYKISNRFWTGKTTCW